MEKTIQFDHIFVPSGYPERDKCKICGKYTITADGLKSLGIEIIRSGSTEGRAYKMFLEDRKEAIAHGIITEEQYLPTKLMKLTSERNKKVAQEFMSDIGIDQDRDGQNESKVNRAKKADQKKVKSATEVSVGDMVFYGDTASTGQKKRKRGKVEDRNVPSGMIKVAKKWLPIDHVWIPRIDEGGNKGDHQASLFSDDYDFSVVEPLVPYVGMHY